MNCFKNLNRTSIDVSAMSPSPSTSRTLHRRAFVVGAASALAGCTGVGGVTDDDGAQPVTLSIKVPPADDDPYAVRIARSLSENLERVGVRTDIVPMTTRELLGSVLVDHEFELFVGRHPGHHDPDFLRPLVHSSKDGAGGWQNPYGFADDEIDALLDEQRYLTDAARLETVRDLQRGLIRTAPFAVVAHPDVVHAIRSNRFDNWPPAGLETAADFLRIRPAADHDGTLRIAITDARPTINRNPLSVEFRYRGLLRGLLYEPLGRWQGDRFVPRLAKEWAWSTGEDGSDVTIFLRDATWHDGEPVTADDVAFTYQFVSDTALGDAENPVPAPRYRGRSALVESVAIRDERTVQLRLGATEPAARRALTVPILPRHVWQPRANPRDVAGISAFTDGTEALSWKNPHPVGSGPYQFESADERTSLTLDRFEDHFADEVAVDRVRFRVAPSDASAIQFVDDGEVDATDAISAQYAHRIGKTAGATMVANPTRSFYHVGFNARTPPLDQPAIRRTLSAMIDRSRVVTRVFDGFATDSLSPLRGRWVPHAPEWTDLLNIHPFDSSGSLDAAAVRDAFRAAGYRYSDDGVLLSKR